MDELEKKEDTLTSAFNSAFSYFDIMNVLEKSMIQAKIDKDFVMLDVYLDIYWIMLSEWFDDKEEKTHNDLREEQKTAHKSVIDAIKQKKSGVSKEIIEVYVKRWRGLLKTYHAHGMRMPKTDGEGEVGILSRRAKLRY